MADTMDLRSGWIQAKPPSIATPSHTSSPKRSGTMRGELQVQLHGQPELL